MKGFVFYHLKNEQKKQGYHLVHNMDQHVVDLKKANIGDFVVDLVWDESCKQNMVCVSQIVDIRTDKGDYKKDVIIKLADDNYIVTRKVTKIIPFDEVYI